MKISLITVCFNSAATIRETLRSVAAQDHVDVEHIVVDGASSDDTVALVREHRGRAGPLVSEPDAGIYDAMNKGLRLATGDIVGFLNADDVLADSRVLGRIASAFEDSSVEACYGDLVFVAADDPSRTVRYWQSRPYAPGLCTRGWMPAHPTFYLRRQVYERHGLFDTSFRIAADFEICARMLEVHRVRATYIPEVLVRMRAGGISNGNLRNILLSNVEAARALRKHGFAAGIPFMLRKVGSKLGQLVRRPPRTGSD